MARYLIAFITFSLIACSVTHSGVPSGLLPVQVAKQKISEGALLIDVRKPEEFSMGHVDGAINVPRDEIAKTIEKVAKGRDQEIILYCDSGRRANAAKELLEEEGYNKVYNAGGYRSWVN